MEIDDWDELRWLLATIRAGSIAAAARDLGVDPTTVSRRMQALESRLGVKLFDRLRGGVLLSPEGSRLAEGAADVESVVRRLEREAVGDSAEIRGVVRIALAEPLAFAWAEPLLSLAKRWPALSLQLVLGDQMHSLTRRETDIALRITEAPPSHLVGRALSKVAIGAYAAKHAVPEDPTTAPWIGWTGLADDETTIGTLRAHLGASGPYALHVESYGSLMHMGRLGAGLIALPCVLGETDPDFVRVGSVLPLSRPLWILTHEDLRRSPRIRVVIDGLIAIAKAHADALQGHPPP
ncbi:MAG: LysR family transcriptional regulator [Myxococcota bacterium]